MERRGVREGEGEERPLRPAGWVQVRAHSGLLEGPGTSMSHSKKKERAQMEEIGLERANGGDQLTVLHIQAEQ